MLFRQMKCQIYNYIFFKELGFINNKEGNFVSKCMALHNA